MILNQKHSANKYQKFVCFLDGEEVETVKTFAYRNCTYSGPRGARLTYLSIKYIILNEIGHH